MLRTIITIDIARHCQAIFWSVEESVPDTYKYTRFTYYLFCIALAKTVFNETLYQPLKNYKNPNP